MVNKQLEFVGKNRVWIIIILLIISSIIMPSQFQKGGISQNLHYLNIFLNFVVALIYISGAKAKLYFKIVSSLIFTIIAWFVAVLLTEKVLEIIYGEFYEIYVERIVANLLFYVSISIITIGAIKVLLKYNIEK